MVAARLLAILPVLLALLPGGASRSQPITVGWASAARVSTQPTFATPPLYFEANRGQAGPQVRFLARAPGSTLFLTSHGAVLTVTERRDTPRLRAHLPGQPSDAVRRGRRAGDASLSRERSVAPTGSRTTAVTKRFRPDRLGEGMLRLDLVGVAHPSVMGLDRLPGRVNYLIGNDPRRWHTDIPTYAGVAYRNVYPGIDLVYHGHPGPDRRPQIEYDWIVRPGADTDAVRMRVAGPAQLGLDRHGGLLIRAGRIAIGESRPVVYQLVRGKRSLLSGRYILSGHNLIGFVVGKHDAHLPVVIDPTLVYSTYLGGSEPDAASSVAADAQGNTYVTGYTQSTDFPLASPLQKTLASDPSCPSSQPQRTNCSDAFVTKLSAGGSTMLYSTYLGGSLEDEGNDIAVDDAGDVYLAGSTLSPNFPTVSALQPRYGGGSDLGDAFVAKLNAAGDRLIYSTYLGGQADDSAESMAVSAGAAYVTGRTASPDLPTLHAFQPSFGGGTDCGTQQPSEPCFDAYVAKLTPGGALAYSTYLGGTGSDAGLGIAVLDGNAYVTGETTSTNFPTAHALQPSLAAGTCGSAESPSPCSDAFVAALNGTGSALVYSTYLGGTGLDRANDIAVDRTGSVYVAGDTYSRDFPTARALQPSNPGEVDSAFVTKLDPSGSSLVFSTYLGGSAGDEAYGLSVDGASNVYVAGTTLSADFPVADPIQRSPGVSEGNPPQNGFVAELNSAATSLVFSTYLGGGDHDLAADVALDAAGNLHLAGMATSDDFPTAHALQSSHAGGTFDGWVAEITSPNPPVPTPTATPTSTPTASPAPARKTISCKKGYRLVRGKCVKRPACKKGYRLVHGKCRKGKWESLVSRPAPDLHRYGRS